MFNRLKKSTRSFLLLSTITNCLATSSYSFAETITISGSNTVGAKLIPQCAKAYLAEIGGLKPKIKTVADNEVRVTAHNTDLEFYIRAHGSSTGFRDLIADQAMMSMASRRIKDKEVLALESTGDMHAPQVEHTIAVDGLAILVNRKNPLQNLTTSQIAKVFSGEIKNWQELGGPNLPINIYARDKNSGTWDTFKGLVLRKSYQLREDAQRFESNDELSDRVAADPGGIGFAGLASVRSAKAIAVADEGTTPVKPSHLSVATEDYPLSRRLYVYTPLSMKTATINKFVEFCQSSKGQDIVAEVGFISQNIIATEQQSIVNAPKSYRHLSDQAERLSVNFRFKLGSSSLDNKASRDIDRLIEFTQRPENIDRPLYLVGFTDPGQKTKRAEILSRYRALTLWSKLLEDKVKVQDMMSVGAFMPVSSGEDMMSGLKNSRVEVWISKADSRAS
jgi:phosphate transport system substrate-binding protein